MSGAGKASQYQSGAPRWAFAALIAANAALASGPLFVRLADVGPVAAGFWRLALALPVIVALALWFGARAAPDKPQLTTATARRFALLAVIGGVFFAADLASWHIGIRMTKMANAALFGNAASLILAVVTLVIARRWPIVRESAALLLAAAGALVLLGESGADGQARLVGDLLCLLAGVLYAGYVLSMQRVRDHLGSWHSLALSTAAGTVPLLLFAWWLGEAIMPQHWTYVALLAGMSQIVGQGLLIYALPHFSALVIGLTLLTQPAIAALIGWGVYGERLSLPEIIGGLMLAAALVLIRLQPTARP